MLFAPNVGGVNETVRIVVISTADGQLMVRLGTYYRVVGLVTVAQSCPSGAVAGAMEDLLSVLAKELRSTASPSIEKRGMVSVNESKCASGVNGLVRQAGDMRQERGCAEGYFEYERIRKWQSQCRAGEKTHPNCPTCKGATAWQGGTKPTSLKGIF